MDHKVTLALVRNNEQQVSSLINQRYERGNLFPQLSKPRFNALKEFLQDQEELHDLIVYAVKLITRYIHTLTQRINRPLGIENSQTEDLLFLVDCIFRHGLKIKRTLFGYIRPYWSMITEIHSLNNPASPIAKPSNFEKKLEFDLAEEDKAADKTAIEWVQSKPDFSEAPSGLAWIAVSLNQGALSKRISKLLTRPLNLRDWYEPYAFLIGDQVNMVCDLLTSLESVEFSIEVEESKICELHIKFENSIPETGLKSWLEDNIEDLKAALDCADEGFPIQDFQDKKIVQEPELPFLVEPEVKIIDKEQNTSAIEDICASCSKSQLEIAAFKRANLIHLAETGRQRELEKELKEKVTELSIDIKKLKNELDVERTAREDAELKFRELGSQLAHVLNDLSLKQNQTNQLLATTSSSQKQSLELQDKLYNTNKKLEDTESQLYEITSELSSIKISYHSLETQLKEKDALIEILSTEMTRSKLNLSELNLDKRLNSEKRQNIHTWQDDSLVTLCTSCQVSFSIYVRKHHCRRDGKVYCDGCTPYRVILPSSPKKVRVCKACFEELALGAIIK